MILKFLPWLFVVSPLLAASPTIVSAEAPQQVLEVAKGFGSASLEQDSDGDPKISGRIEGTKYLIHFYGCKSGANCDDIQFSAAWSDTDISVAKINEWNRSKRYGKAYIDADGDPVLEMAVNLDYGVTKENLEDSFDWWLRILQVFKQEVLQ